MPAVDGEEHERRAVGTARVHERGIGVEERFDGPGIALSDGGGEGFERVAHAGPQVAGVGVPSAGGAATAGLGAGVPVPEREARVPAPGGAGGSPFGNVSALQK